MLEKIVDAFNKYYENYDKTEKEISLKYEHSFAVMNLMSELAFRLGLDDEDIKLARVIGLLHDIGRFEQWKNYHTFSDIKSGLDHAEYGADYLFKDGHIRDFIDTDKYDSIIEKAIRYHNMLELPVDDLTEKEKLFCQMIRDMDKVDIYKQLAVKYTYKFDAKEVSEKVLMDFKEEKSIDKKDTKTDSDKTLLVLALVFNMRFNESFDILVEEDNFDLFLSTIEVSSDSENLWRKVREVCFDKINRGVENVR